MGSTTIHPFPELRVYAEEEARDCHNRFARLTWGVHDGWSELDDDAQLTLCCVHAERLCDLTRPMSRYAVSVLVGNRIHWDGHSVALSVETGGINIHALFRDCGFKAEPSLNAGADLALIVRHLWPEEVPRG